MIELCNLEQKDFALLKSWINNQYELLQFSGTIFKFPVTDDQLLKYINDSRRIAYIVKLIETNEIIGNAELNFENQLPRLSRIIIGNKAYRNKGLGKNIVNKMLEKLFFEHNFQQVDLNVFDWNTAAIKCFKSIGFVINPSIVKKINYNKEIWTALNMTISKKDWIENDSNKEINNANN